MTDFSALLRALSQAGVEYSLVGGAAATVHGSARLTLDVDVVYRRAQENLARVVASLADARPYLRGAPPGLPFRWDVETLRRGLNFTLATTLGPIGSRRPHRSWCMIYTSCDGRKSISPKNRVGC